MTKVAYKDSFKQKTADVVLTALQECFPEENFDDVNIFSLLEMPPQVSMGDWALPCFIFAKKLRKGPPQIAQQLASALSQVEHLQVEAVKAFCNITWDKRKVFQDLYKTLQDGSYFQQLKLNQDSGKVMIEFSQPNTHKAFHVGHGRNVCLGDSVVRLYKALGHDVLAVNYIGDEGTHIAKCLWQLDRDKNPPAEIDVHYLGQCYAKAQESFEDNPDMKEELSVILRALEEGQDPWNSLWLKTRKICLEEFGHIYQWMDVHFDHFFYESEVSKRSQEIVDKYLQKGLFHVSDGAVGMDMKDVKLGFFMARKSDGTTLYITKDLALAEEKFQNFGIERSIYVVADEQSYHFNQLFEALKRMNFPQASECYHLKYGMVVRAEGKMSSRKGNTFTFADLVDSLSSALDPFLEKYKGQWDDETFKDVRQKLIVGAIRYGMLCTDPNKEIVFIPEEWASFEGHSGIYLMYSYSRAKSILRKCDVGAEFNADHLDAPIESELIRHLLRFNEMTYLAYRDHRPSGLAQYLFELCKVYNRFYISQKVAQAPEEIKAARWHLTDAFARVLFQGLQLLGITPPERM